MVGSKEKKEEHFGKGKCNNPQKNHATRIKNSGSLEESYKKGFENCKQNLVSQIWL